MEFSELIGKTLAKIDGAVGDERITFEDVDGNKWGLYHKQDCCESVNVEDICGDLADLIGSPIVQAEESSSTENPEGVSMPDGSDESFTWTFYKLATAKGYVTIRWYGSSNGYYSESVSFCKE